eukprot:SM000059S18693  [mRNA]  locus=s59:422149:425149:+ [translate_table: standard]
MMYAKTTASGSSHSYNSIHLYFSPAAAAITSGNLSSSMQAGAAILKGIPLQQNTKQLEVDNEHFCRLLSVPASSSTRRKEEPVTENAIH